MSKYTKWLPGDLKPVRVGVYQRKYKSCSSPLFCMWNGREWMTASVNKEVAAKEVYWSHNQRLPWRGLAEKPQ